jgi:hypothetical protein
LLIAIPVSYKLKYRNEIGRNGGGGAGRGGERKPLVLVVKRVIIRKILLTEINRIDREAI